VEIVITACLITDPLSVLAMLNAGEVINTINIASPDDPSLTNLWQQAQAMNPDLDDVRPRNSSMNAD
jgi:hypothetical protein